MAHKKNIAEIRRQKWPPLPSHPSNEDLRTFVGRVVAFSEMSIGAGKFSTAVADIARHDEGEAQTMRRLATALVASGNILKEQAKMRVVEHFVLYKWLRNPAESSSALLDLLKRADTSTPVRFEQPHFSADVLLLSSEDSEGLPGSDRAPRRATRNSKSFLSCSSGRRDSRPGSDNHSCSRVSPPCTFAQRQRGGVADAFGTACRDRAGAAAQPQTSHCAGEG